MFNLQRMRHAHGGPLMHNALLLPEFKQAGRDGRRLAVSAGCCWCQLP